MKNFDFRLETVLKVRKQEEAVKRKELMEQELLLHNLQKRAELLQEESLAIESDLREQQQGKGSAQNLASHLAYLHSLQEQIILSQDDLMRQKNVTEGKRRMVAEAQKKKKMIENLKEKQYLQWKQEIEQKETEELDEIATLRHTRKNGE